MSVIRAILVRETNSPNMINHIKDSNINSTRNVIRSETDISIVKMSDIIFVINSDIEATITG